MQGMVAPIQPVHKAISLIGTFSSGGEDFGLPSEVFTRHLENALQKLEDMQRKHSNMAG